MRAFALSVLFSFFLVLSTDDAHALSLKNFRELAAFYSAATNVPLTEPKVKQAYENVRSRLPKNGTVDELSSPAVLGALELSGAFCTAFIGAEAALAPANRRAHQRIDFAKAPKTLDDADLLATARVYAKLFWLRDPRASEDAVLASTITRLKNISSNDLTGTRQLLLTLCTQTATSLEALVVR